MSGTPKSVTTVITVDGTRFIFITSGVTTAYIPMPTISTTKGNQQPSIIIMPELWLITRATGELLFALRPNSTDAVKFRVITVEHLYKKDKTQWFEPLADNYRELVWKHPDISKPGTPQYDAFKHFTWNDLIEFSKKDRWSISFASGLGGDWKELKEGGDGYYAVNMSGTPYWTDAVGQFPFAIDTTREGLKDNNGNKDKAIAYAVQKGIEYGDGNPVFPKEDMDNSYDNYMILRACLWTVENYDYSEKEVTRTYRGSPYTIIEKEVNLKTSSPYSDTILRMPIDAATRTKHALWNF